MQSKGASEWDSVLESLADDCVIMGRTNLLERFRAKLLPLLEAGQASEGAGDEST